MLASKYSVIPGAESFYKKGNKTGILIIHGFVGTPQSVRYIGEKCAEKGYTVMAPRLRGHGTHFRELSVATYHDWVEDCKDAYNTLTKVCDEIYIVGQSMGGTLALLLASKLKNISGVITINAAIAVPGYEQYKNAEAPQYVVEGTPDINDETVEEITYDRVPLHSIKQLLSVIEDTKAALHKIKCPLLLIKSRIDHVVPPECTDFIYKNVTSQQKSISILNNSYHVASMDFDKDQIIADSVEFIKVNNTKKDVGLSEKY